MTLHHRIVKVEPMDIQPLAERTFCYRLRERAPAHLGVIDVPDNDEVF